MTDNVYTNMQNSLYLTWLSCKDFMDLNRPDNQQYLQRVWAYKKREFWIYFENQKVKFKDIASNLKELVLNINPNLSFGYDPERDSVLFNLWSILYDINNDTMMPSLPWKLAAQLVHEHDHYLFLKSADMLGKEGKAQDKFFNDNWVKAEKSAYCQQIQFLKGCKQKISSTVIPEFAISGWACDGKPTWSIYKSTKYTKQKIDDLLCTVIAGYEQKVKEIESDKYDYSKESAKNDQSMSKDAVRILALPIDLEKIKAPFPEVKLKL